MAEKELEFTTRLTREDVAGIIEALIDGLKEGQLHIQKSGESLSLEVPRVVDLEIEASYSPARAKFEIEVSWRPNREENPDLDAGSLQKKEKKKKEKDEKEKKKAAPASKNAEKKKDAKTAKKEKTKKSTE